MMSCYCNGVTCAAHEKKYPLHYAVKRGNQKLVKELIRYGADVNEPNDLEIETCLFWAIRNHDREMVTLLLYAGADLEFRNYEIKTPLAAAVKSSDIDMVKFLISTGAKVDRMPLHDAVSIEDAKIRRDMTKLLLDHGAYQNPFHSRLTSILHLMAELYISPRQGFQKREEEFVEIAGLLFAHGLDVTDMSESCYTPCLIQVLEHGSVKTLKFLLDHGLRLDQSKEWPQDPLLYAVVNEDISVLEYLLNMGICDIDCFILWQEHRQGGTPLHLAVDLNKLDYVELLLEYGACVNYVGWSQTPSQDNTISLTPLYRAFQHGNIECANVLLANGAKVAWEATWTHKQVSTWNNIFQKCHRCLVLAIIHLVLQKSQGYEINFGQMQDRKRAITCILNRCESELSRAKEFFIHDSVTLYEMIVRQDINLLVKRIESSTGLLLLLEEIRKQFPYYGPFIECRALRIFEKQELMLKATLGLSKILDVNVDGFSPIYHNILRYLHNRDLQRLRNL
ncbi:hypothetical protein QAD02_004735 [Eretmocerus hayati]|uniref:Uncharacterized protein n=1 Tax=Eretmocerus hayati TaxID=131215 RepID=A0ACC2NRL3_9HYME|nr:hypothetical protein QAD02_004735 [Eretmocerus hayati]